MTGIPLYANELGTVDFDNPALSAKTISGFLATLIATKSSALKCDPMPYTTVEAAQKKEFRLEPTYGYIVHLVKWADEQHATINSQTWYVDENSRHPFGTKYFSNPNENITNARIYGKSRVLLVAIYIDASKTPSDKIKKDGNGNVVAPFSVKYSLAVTKKRSQPITDLIALLGVLGAVKTAGAGVVAPPALAGYVFLQCANIPYVPSDIAASASAVPVAPADGAGKGAGGNVTIGSQTFDDEGFHRFSFGFAVPVASYRDVSYTAGVSTIQPTAVQRQNIYADGNLYLAPIDTKQTQFVALPHFLFGMPIQTQPLRHLMAGMGIGLNWIEPFFGVVFDVTRYHPPNSTDPNKLENRLVRKGVYGINLPVSTVVKLLSGGKSASSSTSSGSSAAPVSTKKPSSDD